MKLTDDANRAKCSFSLRSIDDEQTLNRVEKKIGLRRQEEDKNVLYTNVSLYRNVAE